MQNDMRIAWGVGSRELQPCACEVIAVVPQMSRMTIVIDTIDELISFYDRANVSNANNVKIIVNKACAHLLELLKIGFRNKNKCSK